VTVLCDGGDRYRSRLYDRGWLKGRGLQQPEPVGSAQVGAPTAQQI
jgi:cysteine synthase A